MVPTRQQHHHQGKDADMTTVKFVPGEMVWLCSYNRITKFSPILVMCLEEHPVKTFLYGSEVITIESTKKYLFGSIMEETKLFKTEEDCQAWFYETNKSLTEERIKILLKLKKDAGLQGV